MKTWITDSEPSPRFPLYTRANADEVGPNPFPPLTWTLAWEKGAIPGTVDAWVHLGGFRRDEFREPVAEVYGCWGGYFYNQVSVGRVFGGRAPGGNPDDIDRTYFGSDPDVPPYTPDPRDVDVECTAALGATMTAALTEPSITYAEEFLTEVRTWAGRRPDLAGLSDADLVTHARRACADLLRRAWDVYIQVTICASVGPGTTHAIAAALGRPESAVTAFTALGDVESAETNKRIWELSRRVADSERLTAQFDAGTADLAKRLGNSADPDADRFLREFRAFLDDHGHRSPNEYDLASPTWAMRPSTVLEMIDRIRHQDATAAPSARTAGGDQRREEAVAELIAAAPDDDTAGTLTAAIASGQRFFRMRESVKDALVRAVNEVRLPLAELGARLAQRSHIDAPEHIFQALDSELDALVAGGNDFAQRLRRRAEEFAELGRRRPPTLVMHGQHIPPISEWPLRATSSAGDLATPGTVLEGIGASPGIAEGTARVVDDLSEVDDLEPGEILVCAVTDPSWTPLLMVSEAVVCQVGAEGSHAAVISRELGTPCVMSVRNVLNRLKDGQRIRVDGTKGTVTVLE